MFVAVGALVLFYLPHHAPHDHFGAGNSVTLVRSALVCWLAGFIFLSDVMASPAIAWSLASAGGVVLILDGVDGWLARKTGQTSRFGARFDMEIDSLFAIVLALLVWQTDKIGFWVLLIGLPRPIFVLAAWFEPRLKNPLPESLARKTICVVQIAALILLLAPAFQSLMALGQ
jgi:phosphatidylglycerophosphate synthase